MRDIKDEVTQANRTQSSGGLNKLAGRNKLGEAKKAEILSHMSFTTELAAAADTGLVVEATIENLDIKKSIFAELDSLCKPETILTSSTPSTSITAIAAATKRPDKLIGMHFPDPAVAVKLVEVIRGAHTSDETCKTIVELTATIGKEPVEVNEVPDFVVNKILVLVINEGIDLVCTGVAGVEGVGAATKLGANHPMGPLALGDLVDLDVRLAIVDTLYDETHDPKHRVSLLLRKMVRAGKLGRRTGVGFYDCSKR